MFAASTLQVPIGGGSAVPPVLTASCNGVPAVNAPITVGLAPGNTGVTWNAVSTGLVGDAGGQLALPPVVSGLVGGSFTVEASWAGVSAVVTGSVTGALTGLVPPQDPVGNVGGYGTSSTGAGTLCLGPPGATCFVGPTGSFNYGRSAEGLGPVLLPSNWADLTVPQQLFVLTDLERSARGLPTVTGLASDLDAIAQLGADAADDPPGFSVWAGGYASSIDAMVGWMYEDGLSSDGFSPNLDCVPPGGGGCWGHRDAVLYDEAWVTCGASCGMGAAFATVSGRPSYTEVFEPGQTPPDALNFTWSQELPSLPACEQSGDTCSWSSVPQLIAVAPAASTATSVAPTSRTTATSGAGRPRASAHVTDASISGIAHGRVRLSFTLVAGTGLARLASVTIRLPRGLKFSDARRLLTRGIAAERSGTKLRSRITIINGTLRISLMVPAASARFTISHPAIAATRDLAHAVKVARAKALLVLVSTSTAGQMTTVLTLHLNAH